MLLLLLANFRNREAPSSTTMGQRKKSSIQLYVYVELEQNVYCHFVCCLFYFIHSIEQLQDSYVVGQLLSAVNHLAVIIICW